MKHQMNIKNFIVNVSDGVAAVGIGINTKK